MKFNITDGKTSVRVTFWDSFAELLEEQLKDDFEYPLIIIISCARITEWQGNKLTMYRPMKYFLILQIL